MNSFSSVNRIRSKFSGATLRWSGRNFFSCSHFFVSYQKLNPFELVLLELKILMANQRSDTRETLSNSLNSFFFFELAVPSGIDCSFSDTFYSFTGVAELLEPFDGPPVIWSSKLQRNVAVAHPLLM